MKHVLVIELQTDKPIEDLTSLIAGRVYTIDGRRGDVVCTTFAEYAHDLRKRADINALPVMGGGTLYNYNPPNFNPLLVRG